VAGVLQRCRVVVVGARDPEVIRRARMEAVATMEEALALVAARHGARAELLVVPRATQILPVVAPMTAPASDSAQ
jgi:hypothetical protein